MSGPRNRNPQYRRPRAHFSDAFSPASAFRGSRQLLSGSALLLGLALVMILAMIPLRSSDSDAEQVSRDAARALQADCALIQQMTYAPCGHQVTRRVALPAELAGKGRSEMEAAYDAWQVTAFAPAEVSMERTIDLYCPQHIVLLPDETGKLCAWQNKYGDALALVKSLDAAASELPQDAQEAVRRGLAFDTLEALEKWVESAES